MEKIADSLKNNQTHLRVCIQYEVLDNKPPSESYKNFCRKMGDDVMDYQEFEFWYMRFYDGDLDLDFDMSTLPPPLTLSTIPVEIVGKIVKKLDPIDRIVTRQVSPNLRDIVDGEESNIKNMRLETTKEWTAIKFGDQFQKEITYLKTENDFSVSYKGVELKLKKEKYLSVALDGILASLKSPNLELDKLVVYLGRDVVDESTELMRGITNGLDSTLHVKHLSITARSPQLAMTVLQLAEPGILEKIEIHDEAFSDEIVHTEHWRRAKVGIIIGDRVINRNFLSHFYHFTEFAVNLEELTEDQWEQVVENLGRSPYFKKGCILSSPFPEFPRDLRQQIDRPEVFDLMIPNSNDYLRVRIETYMFGRKIIYTKISG